MVVKNKTRYVLRIVTEIIALALIVLLVKNRKLQMWFLVFGAGVLVSLFAGRFFCGWVCPMGTLFRPIGWVYKKLGIKRLGVPKFMEKGWVRVLFLLLFVALMVVTRVLKLKVNVLLYMIVFSVVLTLVFTEELWHRRLCPFGTILSVTSRLAPGGMNIKRDDCIACGKCQRVCPSGSIVTAEDKKRINRPWECLLCYNCVDTCPTDACVYGRVQGETAS